MRIERKTCKRILVLFFTFTAFRSYAHCEKMGDFYQDDIGNHYEDPECTKLKAKKTSPAVEDLHLPSACSGFLGKFPLEKFSKEVQGIIRVLNESNIKEYLTHPGRSRVEIFKKIAELLGTETNLESYIHSRYDESNAAKLIIGELKKVDSRLLALAVDPGIVFHLDKFIQFLKHPSIKEKYLGKDTLDVWELRNEFRNSFPKETWYRALKLTRDEFEEIEKTGIKAPFLYKGQDMEPFFPLAGSLHMQYENRENNNDFQEEDILTSVTQHPEIGTMVASGENGFGINEKHSVYVIPFSVSQFDYIYPTAGNLALPVKYSGIFKGYHPNRSKSEAEIGTTEEGDPNPRSYPKDIESFIPLLIEPGEIDWHHVQAIKYDPKDHSHVKAVKKATEKAMQVLQSVYE